MAVSTQQVASQPPIAVAIAPRDQTPNTKVRFGIILELNGTLVPVTTGDIANAKANGLEFTLQQPVSLPDFNAFSTWISTHFNVTIPAATDLPPPLDTVVGRLEALVVTIETFHIKIAGSATASSDPGSRVQLTVEANATFGGDPVELIPQVLGIQGFIFGFSNEPMPKPTPPTA